ncbi:4050_t:CDS:2 [Funneliformis caledonium]|uniref:4050_t:CDS:1 n=1 Tax=Funneliformis caledonium TaxID=1117310 RepID=A0A9N9DB67_9GLOM|nr:4050_t:CDS:2 [Funneliformis caledonium]
MSLCYLYERCSQTFIKQQGLTQHIHNDDAVIFQDEKVFEKSDPFKRKSSRVESTNFNNTEELDYFSIDETSLEIQNSSYSPLLQELDHNEEIMSDNEDIIYGSDTDTDSVDSEDFCGASFEDAVNDIINEHIPQWPNEIYQEFAKICIDYELSNQAINSFIRFFNKNANLEKSPLPKNSKEMHEFMNSMAVLNLDFKKKFIIDFEEAEDSSNSDNTDSITQFLNFSEFLDFYSNN